MAAGLAAVVPASFGEVTLAGGGLAPLALAAVVGLLVGAPIAAAEWRTALHFMGDGPVGRGLFALAELLGVLLVAAVAAPLLAELELLGMGLALVIWLGIAQLVERVGAAPAAVFAVVTLALALVGAVTGLAASAPWTLVDPTWGDWRGWAPGALVVGLLLTPVGVGQWATGPDLPPGGSRVAWATTGFALLLALAASLRAGARFEATLGATEAVGPGGGDVLATVTLVSALLGAAFAVVARRGSARARWTRAGIGLLATIWFVGPAVAALPLVVGAVIPGGLALVLAAVARYAEGPPRWAAGVGAVLAIVAAATDPSTLPATIGGASALALTLVGMFWYVATRAVEKP